MQKHPRNSNSRELLPPQGGKGKRNNRHQNFLSSMAAGKRPADLELWPKRNLVTAELQTVTKGAGN